MAMFSSPCEACKFLRRKCVKGCVFAPYFCHDQGAAHFAAIHKVFGASNASKLLMHLPDNARSEAALTISYEAQARLHDPVYGCVAHIFALQQQVVTLQAQLQSLKDQASQGYTDEFLMPGTQQDNIYDNNFMAYQQGEGGAPHPEEYCTSIKNESLHYFSNDILTCTSMQYPQHHNPHKYTHCTASFNKDDPSCTMLSLNLQGDMQKNGYYDTPRHENDDLHEEGVRKLVSEVIESVEIGKVFFHSNVQIAPTKLCEGTIKKENVSFRAIWSEDLQKWIKF